MYAEIQRAEYTGKAFELEVKDLDKFCTNDDPYEDVEVENVTLEYEDQEYRVWNRIALRKIARNFSYAKDEKCIGKMVDKMAKKMEIAFFTDNHLKK